MQPSPASPAFVPGVGPRRAPRRTPLAWVALLLAFTMPPALADSVSITGVDGAPGVDGVAPGQAGSAGRRGGNAGAGPLLNGDAINASQATGGNGGSGGAGQAGTPTLRSGAGGAGGGGGAARASSLSAPLAGAAEARSTARGGSGGAGGASGGDAGAGVGAAAKGGAGGSARASAIAGSRSGDNVTAGVEAFGGAGGYGRATASGGAGGAVSLLDAVSGSTRGRLDLLQAATGGSGGDADLGNPGRGGSATSRLTLANTSAAQLFASGSAAGGGGGGAGSLLFSGTAGDGARALSFVSASGTGTLNVKSQAQGGGGGSGWPWWESIEQASNGHGGAGGGASASARGVSRGAVDVEARAVGGGGGQGTGMDPAGGNGSGDVTVRAYGASTGGGDVNVAAYASGGSGGGAFWNGGAGGSVSQVNAVAGRTTGALSLTQEARAGMNGIGFLMLDSCGYCYAGAGSATSRLDFSDSHASRLTATVRAFGYNDDSGYYTGGPALASVKLVSSVAGASPTATAIAEGGVSGVSASAEARSTAANGSATARSEARSADAFRQEGSGSALAISHARGSGIAKSSAAADWTESRSDALGALGMRVASLASGASQTRSSASFGSLATPAVPEFSDPFAGLGSADGYSDVDGAPSAAVVGELLSRHAQVDAALQASGLSPLAAGVMGSAVPYLSTGPGSVGADFRFALAAPGHVLLGLLDFAGQSAGVLCNDDACSNPVFTLGYTLRVSNYGATLLERSFSTLAGANAYFSDHAVDLGRFGGPLDLSIRLFDDGSFGLGQTAHFSYLLAAGPLAPVPEPAAAGLLLAGLGLLVVAARVRGAGRYTLDFPPRHLRPQRAAARGCRMT